MNKKCLLYVLVGLSVIFLPVGTGAAQTGTDHSLKATLLAAPYSAKNLIETPPATLARAPATTTPRLSETFGKLPLNFEANHGQADEQVKFLSRGTGYSLFFTSAETVLVLRKPNGHNIRHEIGAVPTATEVREVEATDSTVLRMRIIGANRMSIVSGQDQLPGKVNYLIGNDSKKWRTNIPTYAKIKYSNVYPGVDLVYYGNHHQLECDFIVAPGTDPSVINVAFEGIDKMSLDAQGNLLLYTTGGEVIQKAPLIYQEIDGVKQAVPGGYTLRGKDQIGFQVARYDATKSLVIDPVLSYSLYLGGTEDDVGIAIVADSDGNAYITGTTNSDIIPFPPPVPPLSSVESAFQPNRAGSYDAAVAKLDSTGSQLTYFTYLGGTGYEQGLGIALDTTGNAYVTGFTNSTDFPTTDGAFQECTANPGYYDAFVAKLSHDGSSLLYSTYLGGGGNDPDDTRDDGIGIAVDDAGNAYVAGITSSDSFPITAGAWQTAFGGGAIDAFVAKFNSDGSLVYATYLGGQAQDGIHPNRYSGNRIAVDTTGNAYVTGFTNSTDFPTTDGAACRDHSGDFDAFVTKLNADGSALVYSMYLGGTDSDYGLGIALDDTDTAYAIGYSSSDDFPTTEGAFQTSIGGCWDAFVTKLAEDGSALVYSMYLGGTGCDDGVSIAVDSDDNAYVTGRTSSTDFPTVNPLQDSHGSDQGNYDAYVAKVNAEGSALHYSTYLGGGAGDLGRSIALDTADNAYVTGLTNSSNFPTSGPMLTQNSGSWDAFICKIVEQVNRPPIADAGPDQSVIVGDTVTLDGTASTDPDGDPLTFHWSLVARPEGSQAILNGADTSTATLVPDRCGEYLIHLVVNDGLVESETVVSVTTLTASQIIDKIHTTVVDFDDADFKRGGRNSFNRMLDDVETLVSKGNIKGAIKKLEDLRGHVDGCLGEVATPDCNDWIVTCKAQVTVWHLLDGLIRILRLCS